MFGSNNARRIWATALLFSVFTACIGCLSQPSRIYQANVDFDEASRSVMEQYDQDKSSSISKAEAELFPALQRRFSSFDADGNGEVVIEEFKQHLLSIFDPAVGLLSASCEVTQDGRPLEGATVRFVPEKFMADVIPSAEGIVRRDGTAILSVKHEDLPKGAPKTSGLMRPGVYRVEITHPSHEVPEQYNRKTVLGVEVSGDTVRGGPFRFDL